MEARLWQIIENPNLDSLKMSQLPSENLGEDLLKLTAANEVAVVVSSLDAEIKKVPPQGAVYGNRLLANRWFPLQVYIFRPKGRGITPILD